MSDFIELNLRSGGTVQITRTMELGLMPDPNGTKFTYIWPLCVLVKEKPEKIIEMLKELK